METVKRMRPKLSLPRDAKPGSLLTFNYSGELYHAILVILETKHSVRSIAALFLYPDYPAELITIDLRTGKDSNDDVGSLPATWTR
jgi:hypothetical protein